MPAVKAVKKWIVGVEFQAELNLALRIVGPAQGRQAVPVQQVGIDKVPIESNGAFELVRRSRPVPFVSVEKISQGIVRLGGVVIQRERSQCRLASLGKRLSR